MTFIIIGTIWVVIAIIYTTVWVMKFLPNNKTSTVVNILALSAIWVLAPFLFIHDVIAFISHVVNDIQLKRKLKEREMNELKEREMNEADRWEDQREAMFEAWKRKQEENGK